MLRQALKFLIILGVLALGGAAIVQTATAGDEGCYRDCARSDCDSDRCYRNERGDYRGYDDRYDARYDRRYEGDREWYRDGEWSDRRLRYVCDSDGDRCYPSESRYWDYREYYRRHGYHWQY